MAQKVFLISAGLLLALMACTASASSPDRGGDKPPQNCNSEATGVLALNLANSCCNNNASSNGQQGCCDDLLNLGLCQFKITDILNGLGINVNVLDIAADILKGVCGITNDSGDKGGVCNGELNKASSCILDNLELDNVLALCELSALSNIGVLASITDVVGHFGECVIDQYDKKQTTCCSINESDEGRCVSCTDNTCGVQVDNCSKNGKGGSGSSPTQSQGQAGCCNAACNSKSA